MRCSGMSATAEPLQLLHIAGKGLVILGWVVLWRPLDNLLYEWWRPYRMAKTYEMFARLPLVLIAAK
jgi:predicted DCC family thiol-disulfide oxidoreductase YuxK